MRGCKNCVEGFRAAYFYQRLYNKRVLVRKMVRCSCEAGEVLSEKIMLDVDAEAHKNFARWIPKDEVYKSDARIDLEQTKNETGAAPEA